MFGWREFRPRARSSVDRALPSGGRSRRFESCRARLPAVSCAAPPTKRVPNARPVSVGFDTPSVCPMLFRSSLADDRRLLMIGHTDGGRVLTLVIERTVDPTTWLIVTGWSSTAAERKILGVIRR